MRPDEHKQKKNAQYKKKHGIRDDKKSKAVPSKKTESGRVSVATTVSQTSQCKSSLPGSGQWLKKKEDRPHHSASITKDDIGSCGSGSETEMPIQTNSRPAYRRREVSSNWSRYEGSDSVEEDADILRGADFSQLLTLPSTSLSQFRFQDERDFQAEAALSSSEVTDLLTIDCNELSRALHCVPVHKRLNIEDKAFEAYQIELFMESAKRQQTTHLHSDKDGASLAKNESETGKNEATSEETPPRLEQSHAEDDLLTDILGASEEATDFKKPKFTVKNSAELSEQNMRNRQVKPVIFDEHDLLGGIANLNVQKIVNTKPDATMRTTDVGAHRGVREQTSKNKKSDSTQQCEERQPSSIEDALDTLLEMDELPPSVSQTTKDEQGVANSSATDALESWLDDILED